MAALLQPPIYSPVGDYPHLHLTPTPALAARRPPPLCSSSGSRSFPLYSLAASSFKPGESSKHNPAKKESIKAVYDKCIAGTLRILRPDEAGMLFDTKLGYLPLARAASAWAASKLGAWELPAPLDALAASTTLKAAKFIVIAIFGDGSGDPQHEEEVKSLALALATTHRQQLVRCAIPADIYSVCR
jgi:hypothetical protein